MAQGFALNISGIPELQNAINRINTNATTVLSNELAASALAIQKNAKRNAPGNFGKLKQSINIDLSNDLFKSVFSTEGYAPYVEFGTKGNARIPAGYEAFAAQFKGKKGSTMKEFYKAIELWMSRKGIDKKFAFVIIRKILTKGVPAQPFMLPAYEQEKPKLLRRLRRLFT
jgi:HK97 gp10 family phage protein